MSFSPKRGTFSPPKYLHFKSRNKGRVRIKGKDIYLPGKYDSKESRDAYRELVAQLTKEHRDALNKTRGEEILKGECLVVELMVDYLRHTDVYYSQSNEAEHIRYSLRPLRELYGRLGVDEITPKKLKAIREVMIANNQTRSGINKSISRILRMFKWGVSEELLQVTTYQALKAVDPLKYGRCGEVPESPPKLAVDDRDINALEAHVLPEIWAMMQVQRLSGMRPSEVCNLQGKHIRRESDVWTYEPDQHKNAWRKKKRTVYLGPSCQRVLLPFLQADPAAYIFSPRRAMLAKWERGRATAKEPLYGRRKRRIESEGFGGNYVRKLADAYTPKTYRDGIKRACKRAGITAWTPYQIRHTAGEQTREQFGIEGVSAVLGNSIDAAQVYAERNLKLAREVAAKCG